MANIKCANLKIAIIPAIKLKSTQHKINEEELAPVMEKVKTFQQTAKCLCEEEIK